MGRDAAGIVPAAGLGTRLQPLTFSIPKHLVPLLGKAIIEYPLGDLMRLGLSDVCVVVGHLGDMIREYLEMKGYRVRFAYQERRLGIAHAIHVAIEQLGLHGRPLVVYLGDNILLDKLEVYYRDFIEGDYDAYVLLTPVQDPTRFGVAVIEGRRIVRLVEKPREPPSNLALVGVYMFRDSDIYEKMFSRLRPSARGEYEITDLLQMYIDEGYRVGYSIVSRWWKDIGTPEGLLEAMRMLLDAISEPRIEGEVEGDVKTGRVIVEKDAVVKGDILGPAYIGRGSVLDVDARIIAYTSLEEGSIVRSGYLLDTLVLGNGALIDVKGARLESSIVGRASSISVKNGSDVRSVRVILGDKSMVELG